VRPQLEVRKIVAIVLYKFAHGLSQKHIVLYKFAHGLSQKHIVLYKFAHGLSQKHISNRFDVGASIVCYYVDIVCDVLCNKDKLFDKYIKNPIRDGLLHIVQQFEDLTSLPNICGAIDGTQIP
jgi:hypothetical protein